jgi:hypothetical protein
MIDYFCINFKQNELEFSCPLFVYLIISVLFTCFELQFMRSQEDQEGGEEDWIYVDDVVPSFIKNPPKDEIPLPQRTLYYVFSSSHVQMCGILPQVETSKSV